MGRSAWVATPRRPAPTHHGLGVDEGVEPDGEGAGVGVALAAAFATAASNDALVTVSSLLPLTMTVGVPVTPRCEALSVIAAMSALCSSPVIQLWNVVRSLALMPA